MALITAELRTKANTEVMQALDTFTKTQPWKMFSGALRSKDLVYHLEWLGEFSGVREFKDTRVIQGLRELNYQAETKVWEKTIGIEKRVLNSTTGTQLVLPRIRQMALTLAPHGNKLFFDFLKAGAGGQAGGGAKTTYPFAGCYDTQTFFSNSHPVYDPDAGVGTTNDNIVTGTGVDTVAKVKADFESAEQAFHNLILRDGEPIFDDGAGNKPTLIVGSENKAIFRQAFLQAFDANGNQNPYFGRVKEIVFTARLNEDTLWDVNGNQGTFNEKSWFVVRDDQALTPFFMLEKEPFTDQWNEGGDVEFSSDEVQYGVRAEYNMVYAYWQAIQKVYNAGT
jgi:phage major head subunit gpT-like protein